jgi:hypothetical protein
LEIEFKIACPLLFFDAERYDCNLRPTFHDALVNQTIWRRANDVTEVFTGHFKLLPAESHYIFQHLRICAKIYTVR